MASALLVPTNLRSPSVVRFSKPNTTTMQSPSVVQFSKSTTTKRASTMAISLQRKNLAGLRVSTSLELMAEESGVQSMVSSVDAFRKMGIRKPVKAMFERFTKKAIEVILHSKMEARRLGHTFVGAEHLLLGLMAEGTVIPAMQGISLKDVRIEVEKIIGRGTGVFEQKIPFTPRAKRILELSKIEVRKLGQHDIRSEHLLLGLIREGEGVAAHVLEKFGVDISNIRTKVMEMVGEREKGVGVGVGVGVVTSANKLSPYGTDLIKLAEQRQMQIERVAQILGQPTKNNPCLVGEPGGLAIAEGLAQRIFEGAVLDTLKGKKIIALDMHPDLFEERWKKVMEEIKRDDGVILFIDGIHKLIGAQGAADILKIALATGELQCVGVTTPDEYQKHIEKDPALGGMFEPVKME